MRSRNFVFTLNNFTAEDEINILEINPRFFQYGKEIAPTTGTHHLQGMICFQHQRKLASVIKMIPRAHVEIMRGTVQDSLEYTSKTGKHADKGPPPYEIVKHGEPPCDSDDKGEIEAARWDAIYDAALNHNFDAIPKRMRMQAHNAIRSVASGAFLSPVLTPRATLTNYWIWGPSGSGKTTKAKSYGESYYIVNNLDATAFLNYRYEPIVILEDFDVLDSAFIRQLKLLADHDPYRARILYGEKMIRPAIVIVTSNYRPQGIWMDPRDHEPILRRFEVIHLE